MERRKLGAGGLTVSAVGLGCMGMSGGYGAVDRADCVTTIRRAVDLGVTLLDTADFYGGGENERLVGEAVRGRRADVVIATRGGVRSEVPGGPPRIVDGSPTYLRQACDASLARLGVDHVDVYYLGRADPRVPIEDSVGALAQLRTAGKIRHIGLSEVSAEVLRRAHAVQPISVLESEYSLWERHIEAEILPAARDLGVGLVAHSPLGKGFLTGTLPSPEHFGDGDQRRNHPRLQGDNFRHNQRMVAQARPIAQELGVPLSRLALAWLLSRGDDVVPIPGSRSLGHLHSNVAAAEIRLTERHIRLLEEIFQPGRVAGSRHPAHRRAAGVDKDG
ncbi:aldo/keto reductase [Microbispora catharanthi]|uniref:Aldo/keto reductase n=1 Tax=Microbispora catharanthi TaxID=1712871 RepID=A0A5N6BCE4_9ACTN|nr:aldo/keto reductase [Microbispora catharanthi]KAB8178274.1 aldo/keto reductase [Microbispora catharanthi]